MATVGKWGITRDEDGSLSIPFEWPWYWRYAGGVIVIAASFAIGLAVIESKPDWMGYTLGGIGILCGLAVMYEFGCLAIVVTVGWFIWALSDAFLPNIEAPLGLKLGALGAGVGVVWVYAFTAFKNTQAQAKAIENIWSRLNRLEGNSFDGPSTGIAALSERVLKLERKTGIKERDWLDD